MFGKFKRNIIKFIGANIQELELKDDHLYVVKVPKSVAPESLDDIVKIISDIRQDSNLNFHFLIVMDDWKIEDAGNFIEFYRKLVAEYDKSNAVNVDKLLIK